MRRKTNWLLAIYLLAIMAFGLIERPVSGQDSSTITIKTDQGKYQINKNVYGHFVEHLGRCIYDGIYIGDSSYVPNRDGVRNDIIEALVDLKVPVIRWPGGCFADTYHWKDGIGDKSQRPKMVNQWWGGITEDNSFGTHDFLNFCEAINAAPYLAGNVGSGEVKELSDWVQYVNHSEGSPMAGLRIENGQQDPWKVKYWGVGNEMWGCGGNMTPDYYANLYRQYSTFMPDYGVELYRIASGASGNDYNWTEVLMREIPKNLIDGVALHYYAVNDWSSKGSDTKFEEKEYFEILKASLKMEELVTKHIEIMDKYDPEGEVDMIVDEWGSWYDQEPNSNLSALYQQNTMRDAMIAGTTLNIFNNHADRVKMANLAQAVNVLQAVILTEGEKMIKTPTYHVMKMYNVHQDATLLPIDLSSAIYSYGEESLDAISASASIDSDGVIHVSLVNIDANESNNVKINLDGVSKKTVSASVLKSNNIQDYNSFDEPENITPTAFKKVKIKGNELTLDLPACSVVMLEIN